MNSFVKNLTRMWASWPGQLRSLPTAVLFYLAGAAKSHLYREHVVETERSDWSSLRAACVWKHLSGVADEAWVEGQLHACRAPLRLAFHA